MSKHLWCYMLDNCNAIGLIDLDLEAAAFDIGAGVKEHHLAELESRIQTVRPGRYFIPKFIGFQYGTLSRLCPAHKPVFKLVELHQLTTNEIGYQYPIGRVVYTLQEKDQEKEKEKEKEKEGVQGEPNSHYHPDSRTALFWLREKSGRQFRETDTHLACISERLKEPGVEIEGVKQMIERQCQLWLKTEMAEYLRPETLFGKKKFDSYYAAKGLPIENGSTTHRKANPRNNGVARAGPEYGDAAARKLERQMAQSSRPPPQT